VDGQVSDEWCKENTLTIGGIDTEGRQVQTHQITYWTPSEEAALEVVDVLTLLVARAMGGTVI
jgi:hypothetical protein